jgi:hypothetical protein
MNEASTIRSPSTPLPSPRTRIASSASTSLSSCATISFPQRACGTLWVAQNS